MKKQCVFFFIFLLSTKQFRAQEMFFSLYFADEQVNTNVWFSWDMIKKNKVKTLKVYMFGDSLKKDTTNIIKRTYDINGRLTLINKIDDVSYSKVASVINNVHKTTIKYDSQGLIKTITSDYHETHNGRTNQDVGWVDSGDDIVEYTYVKDSVGKITEQISVDNKQDIKTKKKVIHYNEDNEIDRIQEYFCTNCFSNNNNRYQDGKPVPDNYIEEKKTLIKYNAEGKKSMEYFMDGPGTTDTLFTRYTYNARQHSVNKVIFLKRYGATDLLLEVAQSNFTIFYNAENNVSEVRDEKNEGCCTYIYDAKGKLIALKGCGKDKNNVLYDFVYTFYK